MVDKISDRKSIRQLDQLFAGGVPHGVAARESAGDDRLGMSNHRAALFSGAEDVVHLALGLEAVGAVGKLEVAHRISLTAGDRVLITGLLKAGYEAQLLQREVGCHQLCWAGVQQNDILRKVFCSVLLTGLHSKLLAHIGGGGDGYDADAGLV